MRNALRLILPLVAVLGVLTWGASFVVGTMNRNWVDNDVRARARLAVAGAQRELTAGWNEPRRVRDQLDELERDEKILAAAACTMDGALVASTPHFPASVPCARLATKIDMREWSVSSTGWTESATSDSGARLLVSAIPVVNADGAIGFVVLVHDLTFAERRESAAQRIYLAGFGVLAILAAGSTILVARTSWRQFAAELRMAVRERGSKRPEFAPLLSDVRELMATLASEQELHEGGGRWTPSRLKSVLSRYLHGERVIIVANREPYMHVRNEQGGIDVLHPASGLVTALEPVMRACSGVWVAHGSGSADRETSDANGCVRVPPGEDLYTIRRVWLTPEQEQGYYYGFANEGLWPLCHVAHARPTFRATDFEHYVQVNDLFAAAAASEADGDDPIVLVQDYHFALAPRTLRERLPRATILSFWHIPWPNAERLGMCPSHKELVVGLLGSSIVGFHTQQHCNNFLEAVDRYLEARIDRERQSVVFRGHETLVRPYPISIEWPSRWLAKLPSTDACRQSVLDEHGLPANAILALGVDRIDYTKGIEERLLAVERLLEKREDLRGTFTFIQLGAPSRTKIGRYRDLNDTIEEIANRINERFAPGSSRLEKGYRPIILHRAHHEPPTVFRYYRAAQACYVSSLHDGMNLVAKEYIAARDDERGVLVLSRFTGAARELTEALIVNPYDLEEASAALEVAIRMNESEQGDRMRAMRAYVSEWNVYRWAGRMLVDASKLRQGERLAGRLSSMASLEARRG